MNIKNIIIPSLMIHISIILGNIELLYNPDMSQMTIYEKNLKRNVGFLDFKQDKDIFWIQYIQIHEEYQKNGYGKETLEKLENGLHEINALSQARSSSKHKPITYIRLKAINEPPLIRFYTKNGFIAEENVHEGHLVSFVKKL